MCDRRREMPGTKRQGTDRRLGDQVKSLIEGGSGRNRRTRSARRAVAAWGGKKHNFYSKNKFSIEFTPPDPAGIFSEGTEVIKSHIKGSLTIPKSDVKRVRV